MYPICISLRSRKGSRKSLNNNPHQCEPFPGWWILREVIHHWLGRAGGGGGSNPGGGGEGHPWSMSGDVMIWSSLFTRSACVHLSWGCLTCAHPTPTVPRQAHVPAAPSNLPCPRHSRMDNVIFFPSGSETEYNLHEGFWLIILTRS